MAERRALVAVGVLALGISGYGLVALSGSARAGATNVGSGGTPGTSGTNNGVWFTANSDWYVAGILLETTTGDRAAWILAGDYDPTHLNAFYSEPPSCSIFDQCMFDYDYGDNGVYGWNACNGTPSGSDPNAVCLQQWTRLNSHYDPYIYNSAYNICHELGHSVGLRHTSLDSCLKTLADGGSSQYLTLHDVGHINAHY